jgi:hypothetical protein
MNPTGSTQTEHVRMLHVFGQNMTVSVCRVRWMLVAEILGIKIYSAGDAARKKWGSGELFTPEFWKLKFQG